MPVRYTRRLSMHAGDAIVSLAGPLSNILLATLCMAVLRVAFGSRSLWESFALVTAGDIGSIAAYLLATMVVMNVGLGIFNLIPIPPLDGSHLLPRSLSPYLEKIMPFSYVILMAVVYFLQGVLIIPVRLVLGLLSLVTGVDV